MIGRFSNIRRNEDGASAIEFAIIFPVLALLLLAGMEFGYQLYAQTVVNGTIRNAARLASTGSYSGTAIDNYVKSQLKNFRHDAVVTIEKRSYADFSSVATPEPVTSGDPAAPPFCFSDINKNGNYDLDRGSDGLGGAEDIIYYEVTMRYGTLFSFNRHVLNLGAYREANANTIVSNEPFAPKTTSVPPTVCKSS